MNKLNTGLVGFVSQFDVFAAPATLRIRKQSQMKTCCGGFISLLLAIALAYTFIPMAIDLFNFKQISFTETVNIVSNKSIKGNLKMFGATLNFFPYEYFESAFEFKIYIQKGSDTVNIIRTKRCQPQDWSHIKNYEDIFRQYNLYNMYCPNVSKQFQFQINSYFSPFQSQYFALVMVPCNKSTNPYCSQYLTNMISFLFQDKSEIWVFISDSILQKNRINPIKRYINVDTRTAFRQKGGGTAVEFALYQIITDNSLLIWANEDKTTGTRIQRIQNFITDFTDSTLKIRGLVVFTMNQKKYAVFRKVGKIDELFSYVGGLFSSVIALLFFINSYNKFCYEVKAANNFIRSDKQSFSSISSKNINFLVYLKYELYRLISLVFCWKLNWKNCRQIQDIRHRVNKQLSTNELLHKLQYLQKSIKLSVSDKSQLICLNILPPFTFSQFKKQASLRNYYAKILQGKSHICMEDIELGGEGLLLKFGYKNNQSNQKNSMEQNNPAFSKCNINKVVGEAVISQDSQTDIFQQIVQVFEKCPQLRSQLDSIALSQQYEQAQNTISKAFYNLKSETREAIYKKIPILILHRIGKKKYL